MNIIVDLVNTQLKAAMMNPEDMQEHYAAVITLTTCMSYISFYGIIESIEEIQKIRNELAENCVEGQEKTLSAFINSYEVVIDILNDYKEIEEKLEKNKSFFKKVVDLFS